MRDSVEEARVSDRLDGWKAIGAHFNRDRTTAIRWANNRGLPVHRMPGGKRATVYAYGHELDAWLAGHPDDVAEGTDADAVVSVPERPPAAPRRARTVAALLALALLVVAAIMWALVARPRPSAPLPRDRALAALYVAARDDWATRRPDRIDAAIRALARVTREEPGFAPGHAALADALLLAREFGALPDAQAFAAARRAADAALRLDPGLAAAYRARGFILYWWERDPRAAGAAFRRALALAPDDAQSHFWYGNILSDNGEAEAAMRQLDAARLAQPGSVAIGTDHGWALWAAGRDAEGVARLERIARSDPDFAVVQECLSIVRLDRGDRRGYAAHLARFARLRGDRALLARAEAIAAAPDPAAADALIRAQAEEDVRTGTRRDHVWLAYVESLQGDRAAVLRSLASAEARGEVWGDAGYVLRIARRWPGDAQIAAALARRRPPRMA